MPLAEALTFENQLTHIHTRENMKMPTITAMHFPGFGVTTTASDLEPMSSMLCGPTLDGTETPRIEQGRGYRDVLAGSDPAPKPSGRPSEMANGRRVNVWLDQASVDLAAALGKWNVSAGIRAALAASLLLAVSACTTVTTMDGREITNPAPQSGCQVTVYQTYQSAISKGPIEEMCVVRGTSSFSFVHSVSVAIEKQKPEVCACGARNAYIQASSATGWDVASVTLVAFRFSNPEQPPQSARPGTVRP